MVRPFLAALSVVALLAGSVPQVAAESGSASAAIQGLYSTLLGVMKNADSLGFSGRYAEIEPVVDETYNMPLIARGAVGGQWEEFDRAERKRLVETLRRLTTATYAARFNGYGGEEFRVLGEEQGQKNTVLVKTELVTGDGETVQLNYLMHRSKRGWRIFDIYLNGIISEVGVRRSEYTATIEREGLDALIRAMERQIRNYEAGDL